MVLPRESANHPVVLKRNDDPINPSSYRPPGNTVQAPLESQRLDHQERDNLGLAISQQRRRVTRSGLTTSRAHPYALGQRFRMSIPNEPSSPIRQISREPDDPNASHPAVPIQIHPDVRKRRWAAKWEERKLLRGPTIQGERPEAVTALSAQHDKKPFLAILDPDISYSVMRASAVKVLQLQPMVLPKGSERSVFCSRWGVINSELFVETMIGRVRGGKEEVCLGKIRVLDDRHNEDDANGFFGAHMILRSDIFLMQQLELNVNTSPTLLPRHLSPLYPRPQLHPSPTQPSSSRASSATNGSSTVSAIYTPATSVQFVNSTTHANDLRQQAELQQHDFQTPIQPRPPQAQHQNQQTHSQGGIHHHRRTRRDPNRRPQRLDEQHQNQRNQQQNQQQSGFMYPSGGYLATSPDVRSQGLHSHSSVPSYDPVYMDPRPGLAWASLANSTDEGFMEADAGHMGDYPPGNPNLD